MVFGISSLLENPSGFKFDTQQPDESIVLLLRRHPITWLKWILPSLAFFLLPWIMESIIAGGFLTPSVEFRFAIRLPVWLFVTSMGLFYLLDNWLLWYFSCDFVTSKRIVDISFIFPFYKKVSESSLSKIQDISNVSDGLFQSIFNYGDIRIETAGETSMAQIYHSPAKEEGNRVQVAAGVPDFIFDSIPQPDRIQKIILELVAKQKEEKSKEA